MKEQLNKLIEFKKIATTKREVFTLIKDLAIETGWIEMASNPQKEGLIFYSKGSDENNEKDIWVQLRENYDAGTEYFSNSTQKLFNVRTLFGYTPNEKSGVNGTSNPVHTTVYNTNQRVVTGFNTASYPPDDLIVFHYHFTLDRMIFVMTFPRTLESLFVMAGRPSPHYALETKEIGNLSICSNSYGFAPATAMGEPNTSKKNGYDLSAWTVPLARSFMNRKTVLSEIGVGSSTEGFKGYLEGIYCLNYDTNMNIRLMFDGDKIIDEDGNEFTLINCWSGNSNYVNLIPSTSYYAICTKINKPEEGE